MSEEIIKTRIGGLGSSDAKMVAKIGRNGVIGDSYKKRIAIMLGLDEQKQFSSVATEHGNFIESSIFQFLSSKYTTAISNPYTENEKLSELYGFRVFNHIDFEVETKKELIWFECKATNKDKDLTFKEYFDQLCWHFMIGLSKAIKLKKEFKLYLLHYFADEKEFVFEPEKISITYTDYLDFKHIVKGLEIISLEIQRGFEYEKKDEFHLSDLPMIWQNECEAIQQILIRQKDEEQKIEKFKERLIEIMQVNNVKSIKNDFFEITYVAETIATSFDKDKLKKDLPKIFEKYNTKKSNKKAFIKITIK